MDLYSVLTMKVKNKLLILTSVVQIKEKLKLIVIEKLLYHKLLMGQFGGLTPVLSHKQPLCASSALM